jgi:hypothetical protein
MVKDQAATCLHDAIAHTHTQFTATEQQIAPGQQAEPGKETHAS